ncbi:Acetyl-CoA hydrolase/transferase C-terminal domain-containing protein [Pseudomonas cuatrocienegasensis]|uniref:Acetyl-CoA hydrolase/transferase C-terminal domain-containing protein n=1 Tax=Pseudomonas cuatrocienegasensis TaxID=543360 RepID=A0ABY1B6Q8_9PSED|nr:Acetyl-CoA hydrolase/transferase C-terminal domain-containing protein [Pseudomonas cuatrocienegasensis]
MSQDCSSEQAIDLLLARIDGPIHLGLPLGLPLGLGKPNHWVNALYARMRQLPQRQLTIYTALCLSRPLLGDGLQARFLEPFVERVFADYPELDFLADLHADRLPANVRVEQFFLQPGSLLDCAPAQQDYISSNYSHAARDLNAKGLNVIAQLVAVDTERPQHLSLSCNPDITLDLLPLLDARRAAGEAIFTIAQVHEALPYMAGDAELPRERFDVMLREPDGSRLFSTPNMPVNLQDHCIGLHASTLVRDGGTLQIGIGSMGDALTAALLARDAENADYRATLKTLRGGEENAPLDRLGGLAPFEQGLYGCSEMFVNGLLVLADAGIVRRAVYPEEQLQAWANAGALDAEGRPRSVQALLDSGCGESLQIEMLQALGVVDQRVRVAPGQVQLPDGQWLDADLRRAQTQAALAPWLTPAPGAAVLHGGFFLGPQSFYARLRELPAAQRARFAMTGIRFINELYGQEALKRLQRRDARFINTAFTMTLLGAGVADQLEDGRVLSGVGGQYNFVAQGHALDDARSILLLRSWRANKGQVSSNIVWDYGHVTIARHLRDIVVTEYGIADLRGRCPGDRSVIGNQ